MHSWEKEARHETTHTNLRKFSNCSISNPSRIAFDATQLHPRASLFGCTYASASLKSASTVSSTRQRCGDVPISTINEINQQERHINMPSSALSSMIASTAPEACRLAELAFVLFVAVGSRYLESRLLGCFSPHIYHTRPFVKILILIDVNRT
jgi:hypothetical protein